MVDLNTIGYADRIKLSNNRYFKHLTIEELKEFGFNNYYILISCFCSRPYDFRVQLWKNEVDYETIGRYELFNQLILRHFIISEDVNADKEEVEISRNFIKFLECIFEAEKIIPIVVENDIKKTIYADYVKEELIIDENLFYEISEIIVAISNHEYEKEVSWKNKLSKEMILDSMVEDLDGEKEDGESITFFSLITSVVLNTPYTYKTVLELNLYQFFQLISKSFKRENSQAIKQGIYSGTIDGKKINAKDYNWLL